MNELIEIPLKASEIGGISLEISTDKIKELYQKYCEKKDVGSPVIKDKGQPNYEAVFPINLNKGRLRVTLPFNSSDHPYSQNRRHFGLDISPFPGAKGQPIFSTLQGVVYKSVFQTSGYGNYVTVESLAPKILKAKTIDGEVVRAEAGSKIYLMYTHMSEINVRLNQPVQASKILGLIGSTGNSTGPHVHFEVRFGEYQDKVRVNGLEVLQQLLRPEDKEGWYHTI